MRLKLTVYTDKLPINCQMLFLGMIKEALKNSDTSFYRNMFYYVNHPEGFYIPSLKVILVCLAVVFFIFFFGYFIFKKLEPRFAEEI